MAMRILNLNDWLLILADDWGWAVVFSKVKMLVVECRKHIKHPSLFGLMLLDHGNCIEKSVWYVFAQSNILLMEMLHREHQSFCDGRFCRRSGAITNFDIIGEGNPINSTARVETH